MNREWLQVVAQAHRMNADSHEANGVLVHRIRGGNNNAMYCVQVDGDQYACKLCVADERHRAQREYSTLRLLERTGLDIAPQPILLDESCAVLPFPVVVYRWVEGKPLAPPLSEEQWSATLALLQSFHSLAMKDWLDVGLQNAWFHWFSFEPYLSELKDFLCQYGEWLGSNDAESQDIKSRLARLVENCVSLVSKSRIDPSRSKIPLRLAHVDQNLANVIWNGTERRLRWLDWEYSGWGDPALDLADLRWHIALENVGKEQHLWLQEHYRRPEGDNEFGDRLGIWDLILATRWPFLIARALWSARNGPDRVRLTMQQDSISDIRARLLRMIERAEEFLL